MKTLIACLIFLSSNAFAGNMKKIVIMATESIEENLALNDGDHTYQIINQDFTPAEATAVFAVATKLAKRDIHSGRTEIWTCISQFTKTSDLFEVSKTECKN